MTPYLLAAGYIWLHGSPPSTHRRRAG